MRSFLLSLALVVVGLLFVLLLLLVVDNRNDCDWGCCGNGDDSVVNGVVDRFSDVLFSFGVVCGDVSNDCGDVGVLFGLGVSSNTIGLIVRAVGL